MYVRWDSGGHRMPTYPVLAATGKLIGGSEAEPLWSAPERLLRRREEEGGG